MITDLARAIRTAEAAARVAAEAYRAYKLADANWHKAETNVRKVERGDA